MFCYKCGHPLTSNDFCTYCGAEVRTYKRIMLAAEQFYNIGYEKAKVRDLSGAVEALHACIKLNKVHLDARNLLGLVYMEMGEIVSALNEWIMSITVQSSKNIANDFLEKVQSNPTQFGEYTAAVTSYNRALDKCRKNSYDLALIELKSVLQKSPNYVQARLLVALIYIEQGEYEKAQVQIDHCLKIDRNNTQALRYKREIEKLTAETEEDKKEFRKGRKKAKDEVTVTANAYSYKSGNDTVIRPLSVKETSGVSTVVNIIIGAVIGVAVSIFLIMPARIQQETDKVNVKVTEYAEQLAVKEADIMERDSQIEKLEDDLDTLEATINGYTGSDGMLTSYHYLLDAVSLYLSGASSVMDIADALGNIDPTFIEQTSDESFVAVYNHLKQLIGPQVSKAYYDSGVTEYNSENYSEAIRYFTMAYAFNEEDSTALYQLGEAYYRSGDLDNAIATYNEVIEKFPGLTNAYNAQKRLNAIEGET